jgi:hypothetical protein
MNDTDIEIAKKTWITLFVLFAGLWFVFSIISSLVVQIRNRIRRNKRIKKQRSGQIIYGHKHGKMWP